MAGVKASGGKKEVVAQIKLQIPAGQATPAPPVGPALGQHGVNIGQFVSRFNEATKKQAGVILPVIITVYKDKSFDFVLKKPPAAVLLKQAVEVVKGSGAAGKEVVGKIKREKLVELARQKMDDLTASSVEAAVRTLEGTARSMGIIVEE
ncbi:MAG: 50S ribosomal protein L11 [Planctomycetota bacterium]|nr:50S ribosomal protein L11 [Planctomycetota bacterium]